MTKTRIHELTAWLLTLAILMTFIPSFTLTVQAAETNVASVTINGVTTEYATLKEAFTAASNKNATITLLRDYDAAYEKSQPYITGNATVTTFDLGGHTLSYTNLVPGVYTSRNPAFAGICTIKNGTIEADNRYFALSAYSSYSCTMTIKGDVSINTTNEYGNAVGVTGKTTLIIEPGASITSDNDDSYGGAICVYNGGKVIINGGSIVNNGSAPAISTFNNGNGSTVVVNGGSVSDMKVSDTYFNVDNDAAVTGNAWYKLTNSIPTDKATVAYAANTTLYEGVLYGFGGAEASLNVTPASGVTVSKILANDIEATLSESVYKFTMPSKLVTLTAETQTAAHAHSWKYELDGTDTIKATCFNADGNCDNTDGGKVTIAAPASLDYTGSNIEAVVTNNLVDKTVDVDVVYTAASGSELTEGKPVKVGTYTAKITVGGVTASVEFSIAPAPVVTSIDFNSDSLAYNAVEKTFYVSDDFPFILKIIGENLTSFEDKGGLEALFKQEKSGGWAKINVDIVSDTLAYVNVNTFTLTYILNDGLGSSKTTAVMVENNDTQVGETKYVSLKHAPTYKLTLNVDENGQAYHNKTSGFVAKDANVTITVVPDTGYELDKLIVDGNDVTASVTNNEYTFIMPAKAVEVSVGFKAAEYTVTFKDWDGSEIDTQTVSYGSAATAPANPTRDGWKFTAWDKAFDNVTGDLTVTAQYAKKTSSTGGGGGAIRYTIKFDADGGSNVVNRIVAKNSKLTEPEAPEKDGFIFAGWYTDEELTTVYDFEAKVTKSFTLYAKWNEATNEESDKPGTSGHNCPSLEFNDLDITKWYHYDTDYVIENDIFRGTTKNTFTPDGNITRAMMITVLYRAEGEPATNRSIPFADVDMGSYYANAVIWGQQNGIIKGYSETEFAPEQDILREQIAAIMHRYAQYKGIDVSVGENTNILSYEDFADISEYAIASMQWAVGSGMIKGRTESTLAPEAFATRVEIAAMLHRFIEANN